MQYSKYMSDIQTAISRAISVQLARTGQTQTWLAEQIGLRPASFSNRMVGRVLWDTDDMARIAEAFGLEQFEFLKLAEAEVRIAA